MDYRIWKYELKVTDMQSVAMPGGAEILSVAEQNGMLCMWAMAEVNQRKVDRFIEIIGTGNPVPVDMGVDRKFIGTVVMTPFEWHVFERM